MIFFPQERRTIGRSGTAVIEFALTAPLLVTLLLGVGDFAPTLMAKFKVGTATQAVADLAAQAATMQTTDVMNFFAIGGDVMAPFAGAPLVQRVTNVASDGKGRAFVYWSCGETGLAPYASRSTITSPPTGLISTQNNGIDTSYVMVESQYTYTPPAGFFLKTAQVMTVIAYTLPRVSTYIGPTTGVPGYVPTKPSAVQNDYSQSTGSVTCNTSY